MSSPLYIEALPDRASYLALLDLCLEECETFSIVLNETVVPRPSASALEAIGKLKPFIVSDTKETKWPGGGTVMPGDFGRVVRVKLSPDSLLILKSLAANLHDWLHPDLPEDLAFYRRDDSVFFASISHEKCSYFEFQPGEEERARLRLPSVRLGREMILRP